VNPFRIEGQKTAAFEVVDVLGDAPDRSCAATR
jgi:threonine synthase